MLFLKTARCCITTQLICELKNSFILINAVMTSAQLNLEHEYCTTFGLYCDVCVQILPHIFFFFWCFIVIISALQPQTDMKCGSEPDIVH